MADPQSAAFTNLATTTILHGSRIFSRAIPPPFVPTFVCWGYSDSLDFTLLDYRVPAGGFEPPTSPLWGARSNQLSYTGIMYGDQPSLHTRRHLTFTAPTIRRSTYDAPEAPIVATIEVTKSSLLYMLSSYIFTLIWVNDGERIRTSGPPYDGQQISNLPH